MDIFCGILIHPSLKGNWYDMQHDDWFKKKKRWKWGFVPRRSHTYVPRALRGFRLNARLFKNFVYFLFVLQGQPVMKDS